jgi:mRNA interferase MazF
MTFMSTVPTPKRGDVWLIDFDPAVGAEMQKVRPAVVISLDSVGRLPLRMVVPLTDWKPQYTAYLWFVEVPASATNGLRKDSGADAFQTRSVSLSRFVRRLGELTSAELDEIASAIALCVGTP